MKAIILCLALVSSAAYAGPCALQVAQGDIGKGKMFSPSDIEAMRTKGYLIAELETLPFQQGDVILSTGWFWNFAKQSREYTLEFDHVSKIPGGGDQVDAETVAKGPSVSEAIANLRACQ